MSLIKRPAVGSVLIWLCLSAAHAQLVSPGDAGLRHDLQRLDDAGLINVPLTAWPLSWAEIAAELDAIDEASLDAGGLPAYSRLRSKQSIRRSTSETQFGLEAAGAVTAPVIRAFIDTPREEAALTGRVSWQRNAVSAHLQADVIANPGDEQSVRADGSYVGATVGNWLISAGWQDRWWGPGHAGSLILSSNARPLPAIAVQRLRSAPFKTDWLRWIGPWTFDAFLGQFSDDRVIADALLLGMRATFRPTARLEIGLSRTAQFCGDGRQCKLKTLANVLLGRDNRGVNVDIDEEPGNQLAGIDLRWRLPGSARLAAYLQWIAEDTRQGGPELGSWLRMAGFEHWGRIGSAEHRSYVELADTSCRRGGAGFSEISPRCGYEHSIYRSGYRHYGKSLGYGTDGDGLSYSVGSTLVQSAGHRWSLVARYAEINRIAGQSATHGLSPASAEWLDLLVTFDRHTAYGELGFGLGWHREEAIGSGERRDDPVVYFQWRSLAAGAR